MKFDHDYLPRDRATSNRPLRNLAFVLAGWCLLSLISGVPL